VAEEQLKPVEIFLIEDNPADVVMICHVLAESGMKVKVHLATDCEQALQMLTEPHFEPSLIVLDLNIPKIPGLNLLERWPGKTPVVIFTSSTDETEKQRALALGALDFVSKSGDLHEFTESICGMVRSGLCHRRRDDGPGLKTGAPLTTSKFDVNLTGRGVYSPNFRELFFRNKLPSRMYRAPSARSCAPSDS
jgi:DNA-binding response OmpR family regulator